LFSALVLTAFISSSVYGRETMTRDGLYRWFSETSYYCFNPETTKYNRCEKEKWIKEQKGFALCQFNDSITICQSKKEEIL